MKGSNIFHFSGILIEIYSKTIRLFALDGKLIVAYQDILKGSCRRPGYLSALIKMADDGGTSKSF